MEHALRVLDFDAVRHRLASFCETEQGADQARLLQPEFEDSEVWRLQALTTEAYDLLGAATLPSLGAIKNDGSAVERAAKGSTLDGETLVRIAEALSAMRNLRGVIVARGNPYPRLADLAGVLPEWQDLERKLTDSLDGGGDVKDSASPALEQIRRKRLSLNQRVVEKMQGYVAGRHRDHLSDPLYTVRDGRYVLPVKVEHKGKVRGIVHDTSASGQTVYIEPEDVLQVGNQIRENEAAERAEEVRILGELSSRVGARASSIVPGYGAAAQIDLILAKAREGYAAQSCLPTRLPGPRLEIRNGRHPELDPETAVPLNTELGEIADAVLITGPNTGGKTVAMKTVGLFVLMTQCGMMLPASSVKIGTFSQVWADIGDEQSLQQSLSTFSGHIKNIAEALRKIRSGALVLLDEIGAGTDPAEGAALAKALLQEFVRQGAKIVASTHYGELKVFAANTPRFLNASMEFDLKSLRPTYRLLMGTPGASHAFRIAERYGIPAPLVAEASQDLGLDEQDVAAMLEKLEQAQRQAQRAQSEADRLAHRLREVEKETQRKLEQAEATLRDARKKASDALESTLREIRLQAADIFEEIKRDRSPRAQEKAREDLKTLQAIGQDVAQDWKPTGSAPTTAKQTRWTPGMSVRVEGYSQIGTLTELPRNGKAQVQLGPLRMTVPESSLSPVDPPRVQRAARPSVQLQKAMVATTEINLRRLRAEDAEEELEKFLDECLLAGLPSARIVHGKGGGVLRALTHRMLKNHRGVASFRLADANEGGDGATLVVFG